MAAPLLQAQIDINAPVAKVWALVSDLSRMPEWSPQCRMMTALGPLRQGTRTINLNHRNYTWWPVNAFFGGVPGFEHELVDGMNRSLARIKAAAES